MPPPPRTATLVVCDRSGEVLGETGPLPPCRSPWWPEVGEVVSAASEALGLEVTVLRLLTVSEPSAGGPVSYLAQLARASSPPSSLRPVSPSNDAALRSDPTHRLWWAEPGALHGLGEEIDGALAGLGRRRNGPLQQRKSWNLSLVVTAPTNHGTVWFKAVPPFLADEGGVIGRVRRVDPGLPPTVLSHDAGRRAVLMDHAQGEDQWGLADDVVIRAMVERWVAAQTGLAEDLDHLLAVGVADVRAQPLAAAVHHLVDEPTVRQWLTPDELEVLDRLAAGLARRMEQVGECGLPDTLVHGDLHPGNWRHDPTGPGGGLTLLDWGDAGVGNPVLDLRAFAERLDGAALQERTRRCWVEAWAAAVPGCDPARALDLLDPVAELLAATTYQRFLRSIEETERVYHRLDPLERLRAALRVAGDR